ncbi:MAG: phospholipase D-like domain-containing protein [Methylococcaceae bacterium]|nr:phospholipase D-like domain-containing protein [Methylococcaceae bacterium]
MSAYLRSEVLNWAKKIIPEHVLVNIVTKWAPQDLVFGASDLEAFEIARKQRWGFYIDQDLHAKSVLIDSVNLFLGSANFTSRGTHLFGSGNNELGIRVRASDDEAKKIKQYVTNSYNVTMPMYMEMKSHIESLDKLKEENTTKWSDDIAICINPLVEHLWVDECFHSSPDDFFSDKTDENVEHDCKMIGTNKPSLELIKQIKMIKWIGFIVNESNKDDLTFGYITQKLHDSIMTDPKPYRKDLKGNYSDPSLN